MYPSNPTRYPEFVADQVLTAQNLQDLFNYLDEQERLTRTNLIGIGIVCGLEVFTNPNGTSVNLSKGVGVTSAGYLVAMPAAKYTHYTAFNAEKEVYYDRFVDNATKKQKFSLWEMAQTGSPQAEKPLDAAFLKDKIVLVFVELLESGNKNCDPDSCDDRGITINVNFRILLVEEKNVEGLIGYKGNDEFFKPGPKCISWPETKLPRYNVPATILPDAASILKNYLIILDEAFLQRVENTLTVAYASTQLLVINELPANPFANLKEKLSFLYDGTINLTQLVMVQYYYDFISDLLQGYEEMRSVCNRYLSLCCPDENLFPRHLLLGAAFNANKSYRHYFIPSPALGASNGLADELRFLMKRLSVMVQKMQIPPQVSTALGNNKTTPIRITPSKLGDVPLSQKAIPYYYNVLDNPVLFNAWNYHKTSAGRGNTNLSYYADKYNASDDHVRFPLKYDYEPYNFWRIEGHIGQNWRTAFTAIYQEKYKHRLPFEVIALNGDFKALIAMLQQSVTNLSAVLAEHPEKWKQILCYFSDIEMQYDLQTAELRCTLGKVMRFLYDMKSDGQQAPLPANPVPVSGLLQKTDAAYRTKTLTYGHAFDIWYPTVKNQPYIAAPSLLQMTTGVFGAGKIVSPLALMYCLEKIHESLPAGIVQVNILELFTRLRDAGIVAQATLDAVLQMDATTGGKTGDPAYILQLNAVIRVCKGALLMELYKNFLFRFYMFMANQSFAMYAFMNSGVQHKAGVTTGGTFIMVYHDKVAQRAAGTINVATTVDNDIRANVASAFTGATAANAAGAAKTSGTDKAGAAAASANEKVFMSKTEVQKLQSVKDAGTYWLAQLITGQAAADQLTDKELLELVDDIPDGMVIADFYVPYVCASECSPMSFIVLGNDAETPVKPAIEFTPKQFCVSDKKEYAGKTSPDGGTLTGEGTQPTTGGFLFMPAQVNLNGAASKKVTITYKLADGQIATVEVEVFAAPVANFTTNQIPSTPTSVSVINSSTFGETYSWTFETQGTSTLKDPPPVDFKTPGRYKITLEVSNKLCGSSTKSVEVEIKPTTPAKKCVDLKIWVDAFKKLDAITDADMKELKDRFAQYKDVSTVFNSKITAAILAMPQDAQVTAINDFISPQQIIVWMRLLNTQILEFKNLRKYAIELFRILEGILLFYACVQKDDIDKAAVSTLQAFAFELDGCLNRWKNIASTFSDEDKKAVKKMLADKKTELDNISATEPAKKGYIEALKKIIELLGSM